MIRHIVFFKVPSDNREAVRAGLSKLTKIPHAEFFEIGENMKSDYWENDTDFIVYGEFETEAALAAYKAHPYYEFCTALVKPLRETRMAADYDSYTSIKEPITLT